MAVKKLRLGARSSPGSVSVDHPEAISAQGQRTDETVSASGVRRPLGDRPHLRGREPRRAMADGGVMNAPAKATLERAGPAADGAAVVLEPSPLELLRARGRLRHGLALLGPAFVAAVAYVDPGNFATNIAGGAQYGYLLLWVILAANLMAMLIQYLSAKVGIATGQSLPELCREHFPRRASAGLWVQAELIAMATDLAEFVGAAIALNLLFGVPLFTAGLITGVVAFAILALQTRGYRRFETTIAGLLGVILLGFVYEVINTGADASGVAAGFVPGFQGTESILLATGILGATVMPHVIYLHSALTQNRIRPRDDAEKRELLRFERLDVGLAMGIAGVVNMSMLVVAAALFNGVLEVNSIEGAYDGFRSQLGEGAAIAFGVALLASGLSSSSVGTYAGQVVMQGFIRRSIPLLLRRLVTMTPALVVLAIGLDPTKTLVVSQVVLSFGIPFALVPLVLITRRADIMGSLRNARVTTAAATVVAGLIIALNVFLLVKTFAG
jgi:manganese transport protein